MSTRPHGHADGDYFDSGRAVSALEAEGELASGLTREAITECSDRLAAADVTVERVVDLGCGPGIATVQLAERFPQATILAVDSSARMLAQTRARAERYRISDRVDTWQLDLDSDLHRIGPCELAYAAMTIHHAKDEVATLTSIRKLLAPHGLLCLLERHEPTERYPEMLAAAGLHVVVSGTLGDSVTLSRTLYIAGSAG